MKYKELHGKLNRIIYFFRMKVTEPKIKRKLNDKIGGELFNLSLNRGQVVKEVTDKRIDKKTDICHIIASGWSLNYSAKLIPENNFVIGFNYAALSDIKFDVYFFEIGSCRFKELSENSLTIAREKLLKENCSIYFKNLWEGCNDVDFIVNNWMDLSRIIKDRVYLIKDIAHTDKVVNYAFTDNSVFLPQICSTTVTATILAYRAGFKKIIIHGLDFGGDHFYGVDGFIPNNTVKEKIKISASNKIDKNAVHKTAQGIGMKTILPSMYSFLKKNKVELYCAVNKSPSSEYIPVYDWLEK